MNTTEPRLVWFQVAPKPISLFYTECGRYTFEVCRTSDAGHMLQMWQQRPEDCPLLVWETDGYSLDEAKERAERLAGPHVPVMMR
jgi:hypothetical protein